MKEYRKKATIFARPYVPGEDMTHISLSSNDTLQDDGWIARDPSNPQDQWYINGEFFARNYEEV